MQIQVFTISGRMERPGRRRTWWRSRTPPSQTAGSDSPISLRPIDEQADEAAVIKYLNDKANEISSDIESEIRQVMPPGSGISPQAEIAFSHGSILVTGTILLLDWAGQIALDTLRDEIAQVIKIAVKRVVGDAVASFPNLPSMTTSVDVTPVRSRSTPPVSSPVTPENPTAASRTSWDWTRVVPIILVVLLLFILILDRYFSTVLPANSSPATWDDR
jgi:hypothetical protein